MGAPIVERLRVATMRLASETPDEATIRRNEAISEAADTITDLLAALEEAMEWVKNWSPSFTEDDEWCDVTRPKIEAAIAKAKGGASLDTGGGE